MQADAIILMAGDAAYPARLRECLGHDAPTELHALGNLELLTPLKTALFCSTQTPGSIVLKAYDQAARWRDEGRCVISGFHSPVEAECLRVLLRGAQPIVVCPARSLPQRLPPDWQEPVAKGRLLILSAFGEQERRVTADLAARRNEVVAALADEIWFVHISPGGQMARLAGRPWVRERMVKLDRGTEPR